MMLIMVELYVLNLVKKLFIDTVKFKKHFLLFSLLLWLFKLDDDRECFAADGVDVFK
jgi:hypothetical protein